MPRLLISADSHVMEPPDLWTRYLPEHLRDHGPRFEIRAGATCLMVENTVVRNFSKLSQGDTTAEPGHGVEGRSKALAVGANDPEARLRDLDTDGVWGEVMYP